MEQYLLSDIIIKLDLTEDRVEYLCETEVEELNCDLNKKYYSKIINVDDVVGIARPIYGKQSWLDFLEKLHKMRNFDIFNKDTFDDVLMMDMDYPEVIKKDDKYYIAGNGKHRLTIAKCLGNKKALVALADYDETEV